MNGEKEELNKQVRIFKENLEGKDRIINEKQMEFEAKISEFEEKQKNSEKKVSDLILEIEKIGQNKVM